MILIFGGTTEGRIAAEVADKAGKPFYYSTLTGKQHMDCTNAKPLSGSMDIFDIENFIDAHKIQLIIDAAHPFATNLHHHIADAAGKKRIPVVRLERHYPARDRRFTWCKDYDDAVEKLKSAKVKKMLALTGVNTISKLKPYWKTADCYFRILDREESRAVAERAGISNDRLIYYKPESESIDDILKAIEPQAVITKESGDSGGFEEKVEACLHHGIQLFVVERPKIPGNPIIADGPYSLRRAIEKYCPGFFELRTGLTTGTCATAAAYAATAALVGIDSTGIRVKLPTGEHIEVNAIVTAKSELSAEAYVIKDAGDDPDVTHRHKIVAKVSLTDGEGVNVKGGRGIGTVTLPGLGLPVGEKAINPVPRKMIEENVGAIYDGGVEVEISVPDGEELAERTFNPRVGVVGGISIIGTTGIVMPFSHEAFMEAIRRELEVARESGASHVVINSGGKSERRVKGLFPELQPQAFIHYGNAIGETLRICEELGIKRVSLGIMIGKAVKLAEGHLDTHSHKTEMNRSFLMQVAADAGCSDMAQVAVGKVELARQLWSATSGEDSQRFFEALVLRCVKVCTKCFSGEFEVILVPEKEDKKCIRQNASRTSIL